LTPSIKPSKKYQLENKVVALDKQAQSTLSTAVSVGAELAKAEIELNSKLMEYEPESSVIEALSNRVNNLRSNLHKCNQAVSAGADRISLPVEKLPQLQENTLIYCATKNFGTSQNLSRNSTLSGSYSGAKRYTHNRTSGLAIVPFEKSGPSRNLLSF
jgi:hypothetical protein